MLTCSTSEGALEATRNYVVANFHDLCFTKEHILDCNLQYPSTHPRSIKNGLVKWILLSVQKRSCEPELVMAIERELGRVGLAGYSSSLNISGPLASMTKKRCKET